MNAGLFQKLIEGEGLLVLERLAARRFRVVGNPPVWTALLLGGDLARDKEVDPSQVFVFLDHFLGDAEPVWAGTELRELTSEAWTETMANREELAFTATAKRLMRRLISVEGVSKTKP